MIIHNGPLPNPAKTLLEDLVSRIGSPTTQSLSPYDGMRRVYQEQHLDNYSEELVLDLLKGCPDYNPASQKPIAGPYVPASEKPSNAPTLQRLEDIDASWVAQYLRDALIGLKIRNCNSLKEYKYQNQEVYMFRSNDGEGFVSPADQLVEYHQYTPITVLEACAKLPYLLKRLQDKSIMLRVSVMSLIIAYEKAKRIQPDPKPSQILRMGVYQVDGNGNLFDYCMPDSANSGRVFPAARSWIAGRDPDPYFYDALELLQVCTVLGIDITQEDPTVFTPEFIENLKVTYISKNRNYLQGCTRVNGNVLNKLSTLQVTPLQPPAAKPYTRLDVIEDTIQAILEAQSASQLMLDEPAKPEIINNFLAAYAAHTNGVPLTYEDFITRDGFLYRKSAPNTVYQVLVKEFLRRPSPPSDLQTVAAIIHTSGYAFLISKDARVIYVSLATLTHYIKGSAMDESEFGEWSICYT